MSSSCRLLSSDSLRKDRRSKCASISPNGITETNVASHNRMPQLAASSWETPKICWRTEIVASCEPPPTPGNWMSDPTMLEPITPVPIQPIRVVPGLIATGAIVVVPYVTFE